MVDNALRSSKGDKELDLVFCALNNDIIEQINEESISFANEVAAGINTKIKKHAQS